MLIVCSNEGEGKHILFQIYWKYGYEYIIYSYKVLKLRYNMRTVYTIVRVQYI